MRAKAVIGRYHKHFSLSIDIIKTHIQVAAASFDLGGQFLLGVAAPYASHSCDTPQFMVSYVPRPCSSLVSHGGLQSAGQAYAGPTHRPTCHLA